MTKILFIAGTRPEAIKIAPVYLEMQRRPQFEPILCATGQHPHLLTTALKPFNINPQITLKTTNTTPDLPHLHAQILPQLSNTIQTIKPQIVIIQGDTLTAHTGAWAAYYNHTPIAHIEAGLRTHNIQHPYPEEAHRRSITIITNYHYAPTTTARDNLLNENVPNENIIVTGNTAIDAIHHILPPPPTPNEPTIPPNPNILVTTHRRANHGQNLQNLCHALLQLTRQHPNITITYILHPNPQASQPPKNLLQNHPQITLIPPQDYPHFLHLINQSTLIITDSGGIQEEAPTLHKPVLVTRQTTERPEAITQGANKLIGNNTQDIINAITHLLTHPQTYHKMATAGNPYGNGQAALHITNHLQKILNP